MLTLTLPQSSDFYFWFSWLSTSHIIFWFSCQFVIKDLPYVYFHFYVQQFNSKLCGSRTNGCCWTRYFLHRLKRIAGINIPLVDDWGQYFHFFLSLSSASPPYPFSRLPPHPSLLPHTDTYSHKITFDFIALKPEPPKYMHRLSGRTEPNSYSLILTSHHVFNIP